MTMSSDEHLFHIERDGSSYYLPGSRITVHTSGLVQILGGEPLQTVVAFMPAPGFSIARADVLLWAEGPDEDSSLATEG